MIDDITYHKVLKPELRKRNYLVPKKKIEEIKLALEALHHNLFCSEVEILFNGYSTSLDGVRCLYDYLSRDEQFKKSLELSQSQKVSRNMQYLFP